MVKRFGLNCLIQTALCEVSGKQRNHDIAHSLGAGSLRLSHRSSRRLRDIDATLFGVEKCHHIDRRHIHTLGQTACVCEHPFLSMAEGINQGFSFGASLFAMHMAHVVAVEIASDAVRGVTGKLFCRFDAAMKGQGFCRACFSYCLLEGKKMCHPSRPHKIRLDQRDAVLPRKVADHLFVDQRDDDFIPADDAPLRGTRKRERMGAYPVDLRIVHRLHAKLAFLIAMANIVMAGRGSEEHPFPDAEALIGERIAKRATLSSCGFVGFIKDAHIKAVACCTCSHDRRRLIG